MFKIYGLSLRELRLPATKMLEAHPYLSADEMLPAPLHLQLLDVLREAKATANKEKLNKEQKLIFLRPYSVTRTEVDTLLLLDGPAETEKTFLHTTTPRNIRSKREMALLLLRLQTLQRPFWPEAELLVLCSKHSCC